MKEFQQPQVQNLSMHTTDFLDCVVNLQTVHMLWIVFTCSPMRDDFD